MPSVSKYKILSKKYMLNTRHTKIGSLSLVPSINPKEKTL